MAEVDQSFGEQDVDHVPENSEVQENLEVPENSLVPEHQEVPEHEEVPEHQEGPEDSQPEQKQEHDEVPVVGGAEKKWPGWPGESVFRMLVPAQKVGSIIGRKGEFIKKIVEETRARIKILDGPPGTTERAVSLYLSFFWFV